jgi:RHS repeat-associated protein
MTTNRNKKDAAAWDMLNAAAVIHAVLRAPTEPSAIRPLLLTVPNPANPEIPAEYYTFGFDQAKNVTELFDSSGTIAATYDFGPFGEDMTAAGPAAALNPFRFSSEVWDAALGLVCYTFRPYNPLDGRFTSRDPIEERGGLNLYGFAGNDPVNKIDVAGQYVWSPWPGVGPWIDTGNYSQPLPVHRDTCGPDVTASVNSTLDDISAVYGGWSLKEKCAACMSLHTDLVKGWDIVPLFELGSLRVPDWPLADWPIRGTGKGLQTVQFKGKCYDASAVNYTMWGRANKLCKKTFPLPLYSLFSALGFANAWKTVEYQGAQMVEADGFTIYGYQGFLPFIPALPWVGRPANLSVGPPAPPADPPRPFAWRWLPNRNPDNR